MSKLHDYFEYLDKSDNILSSCLMWKYSHLGIGELRQSKLYQYILKPSFHFYLKLVFSCLYKLLVFTLHILSELLHSLVFVNSALISTNSVVYVGPFSQSSPYIGSGIKTLLSYHMNALIDYKFYTIMLPIRNLSSIFYSHRFISSSHYCASRYSPYSLSQTLKYFKHICILLHGIFFSRFPNNFSFLNKTVLLLLWIESSLVQSIDYFALICICQELHNGDLKKLTFVTSFEGNVYERILYNLLPSSFNYLSFNTCLILPSHTKHRSFSQLLSAPSSCKYRICHPRHPLLNVSLIQRYNSFSDLFHSYEEDSETIDITDPFVSNNSPKIAVVCEGLTPSNVLLSLVDLIISNSDLTSDSFSVIRHPSVPLLPFSNSIIEKHNIDDSFTLKEALVSCSHAICFTSSASIELAILNIPFVLITSDSPLYSTPKKIFDSISYPYVFYIDSDFYSISFNLLLNFLSAIPKSRSSPISLPKWCPSSTEYLNLLSL